MYLKRFEQLERDRRPLQIGLVGLGAMGKGIAFNIHHTPGMRLAWVGDTDPKRFDELRKIIPDSDHQETENCIDIARSPDIDLFIEASSSINMGYAYSKQAIVCGTDLLLMNGEVDCFYGPELYELSKKNGVLFSSTDGDQYGVLIKLIEEIELMRLRPIMIGNIKGYLDRYANPDMIKYEADIRNLDHIMCVTYTDGTKLAIEMAILSNATGFVPYKGKMEGPRLACVEEVLNHYNFAEISAEPVVEYILGAEPSGGVFVVAECHNDYQRSLLKYYKMGAGPYYLFYRPYHLCHLETAYAIGRMIFDSQPLLVPWKGRIANVHAVAKKDLNPGDVLDEPGMFTAYGEIALQSVIDENRWALVHELNGKRVNTPIKKDQPISLDDLEC
jgi:predicted homoserine dehydrogenase-like protein